MVKVSNMPADIIGQYRKVADIPLSELWISRVLDCYDTCTLEDRNRYQLWYADLMNWTMQLSLVYGIDYRQIAGIFAALSPQVTVKQCKLLTLQCLENRRAIGHYTKQCNVANAFLVHYNVDLLGKYKTHRFARAIVAGGLSNDVVVDRIMLHLITSDSRKHVVQNAWYQYLSDIITEACRRANARDNTCLTVAQFQAVVWCQYRGSAE
jgi:hypothetical protein